MSVGPAVPDGCEPLLFDPFEPLLVDPALPFPPELVTTPTAPEPVFEAEVVVLAPPLVSDSPAPTIDG